MSGLSAPAHYANGIKIAERPALLMTEMLKRFVQSDFIWPKLAVKPSAAPAMTQSFGYMYSIYSIYSIYT